MGVQCGEWFEDGETVTYSPLSPRPSEKTATSPSSAPPWHPVHMSLAIHCSARPELRA